MAGGQNSGLNWVPIADQLVAGTAARGGHLDQGLKQVDENRSRHHHLHLKEEFLPFVLLLGSGELVIRETELLSSRQQSPGLRSQVHYPAEAMIFQNRPRKAKI